MKALVTTPTQAYPSSQGRVSAGPPAPAPRVESAATIDVPIAGRCPETGNPRRERCMKAAGCGLTGRLVRELASIVALLLAPPLAVLGAAGFALADDGAKAH